VYGKQKGKTGVTLRDPKMFGFGKPKAPAKPVVLLAGVPDPVSDPRPCVLSRLNFGCQRRSAGKKVARAVFDEWGVRGGKGTWWPFLSCFPMIQLGAGMCRPLFS